MAFYGLLKGAAADGRGCTERLGLQQQKHPPKQAHTAVILDFTWSHCLIGWGFSSSQHWEEAQKSHVTDVFLTLDQR